MKKEVLYIMSATDKLILVVESDDEKAQGVVAALSAVGYEVVRTREAQAAIDKIEMLPDLIIFSWPKDGLRLAQRLQVLSGEFSRILVIKYTPNPIDIPWLLSAISNAFAAADLSQ